VSDRLASVTAALAPLGFSLRGGFVADDQVPALADGAACRTVLMIGSHGPAMWRRFQEERPAGANPLDAWTRSVLEPVARRVGADIRFPFDRPFLPFQQWLMRAEPCHSSPLGIVIHPVFGLWHGIRAALLLADDIALAPVIPTPSPCDSCRDRPCLTACPVGAFSGQVYDVPGCLGHLSRPEGEDCRALGCRARRACPVGAAFRPEPAQARFHMEAFQNSTL
jgi:ferredoxin